MINKNKLPSFLISSGIMGLMFYLAFTADNANRLEAPRQASMISLPEKVITETGRAMARQHVPQAPQPSCRGAVGRNMTFYDALQSCGFTPQQIIEISKAAKPVYNFKKVFPGQTYEVFKDSEDNFKSLKFNISAESYVEITDGPGGFSVTRKEFPYETVRREVSGVIEYSLFATLSDNGLPIELGIKLADIFAWDIDFFKQIQKKDYFRVIYEEKRIKGPSGEPGSAIMGDIIAAEFSTSGDLHYAFHFDNGNDSFDYFDETGKSLRKQLLRAPLNYSRISSNYSHRRLHPVHKVYKPHLGIDYAAPTGTPVMSTGDGTVIKASRTQANGNYVEIRHNSSYTTYYLHFSRFGKGIHGGAKVKQGQVIGYVGQTGYATGPHLDYRIKQNGQFVNPLKLKLPPVNPVCENRREAFSLQINEQIAMLRGIPIPSGEDAYYAGMKKEDPPVPTSSVVH